MIDPTIYQALAIASALKLYASTKIKVSSSYTPTAMMRTATRITGQTFRARDYLGASAALRAHAATIGEQAR